MKLSRNETMVRQRNYRESHPHCLRPILFNGIWRFCWKPTGAAHHITGRGKGRENDNNKFPMCQPADGGCHFGYGHGHETELEPRPIRTIRLLAIKVWLREANIGDISVLMRGKRWWTPELGESAEISDAIALAIRGMYSLEPSIEIFLTERKAWREPDNATIDFLNQTLGEKKDVRFNCRCQSSRD